MKLRAFLLLLFAWKSFAAAPRWVVDSTDAMNGTPMRWQNPDIRYVVDGGALSSYVSHNAALALIKAAADPWNQNFSLVTLTAGGELAEDVNSANVYLGVNGPIWPVDVSAWNANASRIVVLLDADGSLTDMLLGTGASAPANCRQNAVTESMDVVANNYLQHDIIVVNGRCTGPAQEQQLQLQYQLMRAFGRALGIGWSQTNDMVFTGPSPTYTQQKYWPIMHPIDILCGPYTYQCLINPFQLRNDDIAALALLYPINSTTGVPAGKELSLAHGVRLFGSLKFPSGMGMAGVNVVARASEPFTGITSDWDSVTSVSGFKVKDFAGNPVNGASQSSPVSGSRTRSLAGDFDINRIPYAAGIGWETVVLSTQPLNPLYVGAYAVGPYHTSVVSPSGGQSVTFPIVSLSANAQVQVDMKSSAADCSSGDDGSEVAPAAVPQGGMWAGRFCGYGHTAWMGLPVQQSHSMTIEVTALDEFGNVSTSKALPMIGIWSASDVTGALPTIAASPTPMNGRSTATTSLTVNPATSKQLRIAITEQRGEGRPDFGYQARVLYADSVTPSQLPLTGGQVVLRGMGFQPGNAVMVGGTLAQVLSLSANEIVINAPAFATSAKRDVVVTDLRTGGSTTISGGLQYGTASTDKVNVLNAPSGDVPVGSVTDVPFAVRVTSADGTPIAKAMITFQATDVQFGCGGVTCSVMTDAAGVAQTSVLPTAAGSLVVTASLAGASTATATFHAVNEVKSVVADRQIQYVAADEDVSWKPSVVVAQNGVPSPGQTVQWGLLLGAQLADASQLSNAVGGSSVTVELHLEDGTQSIMTACAWTTVCASMKAQAVADTSWQIEAVSGDVQTIGQSETLDAVVLRVTDGRANAVMGVPVTVYQSVEGWQPPCSGSGRCATPPQYGEKNATYVTDADGLIRIVPLEYANTALITRVVASAGQNGYLSFSLEKLP